MFGMKWLLNKNYYFFLHEFPNIYIRIQKYIKKKNYLLSVQIPATVPSQLPSSLRFGRIPFIEHGVTGIQDLPLRQWSQSLWFL